MQSLGSLLLRNGWITKEQLGLAISKQREIGGRLGSCLLEMGAVSEELLDRTLAQQQGVPIATAEDLREIPDDVIRLLPARIAIRYRAVPFNLSGPRVDIAMLEVDNLWLQDELSFIIGKRLKIHIANEVRLVTALTRHYGAPLPERYAKLGRQLDKQRREAPARSAVAHPDSRLIRSPDVDASPSQVVPFHRGQPSKKEAADSDQVDRPNEAADAKPRSIPLSAEELSTLGTEAAKSSSGGTVSPFLYARDQDSGEVLELEEVEGRLSTVTTPDEVGQVLIEYLAQLFVRAALFQVRRGSVIGWLARGPGLDGERFSRFEISLDEPSIFLNLREGGSFFIGKLPAMPPHVELAACWSKDLTDECVVFPLRLQNRLVSLIYGDRGPLGLQALDLELIRSLTAIASQAFERCILQQKRRRLRQSPHRS